MNFIHETWRLLRINLFTAILFEVGFRILFGMIFIPLCLGMIDLAMQAASLTYLMDANLGILAAHPLSWLLVALSVLVLGAVALFEMCALIILMQAGHTEQHLGVVDLCHLTFGETRRILRPKNWLIIPFVLILVPLTNVALASSAITEIRLPEFIVEFILNNAVLSLVLAALIIALFVHAFRLAFGVHFFTLCNEPWMKARVSSRCLLRGNNWRFLRRILLIVLVIVLSTLTVIIIGALGVLFIADNNSMVGVVLVLGILAVLFLMVYSCFLVPFSYAALSCTFYELTDKQGVEISYTFDKPAYSAKRNRIVGIVTTTCLILGAGFALTSYAVTSGIFELDPPPPTTCEITAHRGGAREAPENTMAAFKKAIAEGADWIELDVQQTSDGVLMVMHDSNLKRTTGLDKNFWEVTYDEIKELDNGSWFGSEFAGEPIPTLEEVLSFCKGKIKLNIEVKPDGHGIDLERKTVELVNQRNMKDEVAIASIAYESLEKVKQIDPTMPTLFNMTLAYGTLPDIEHVDIFSVDEFFVTQEMVHEVRRANKTIYAWTVNDPTNMARLVEYGIDGLVTDDIQEAKEAAETYDPSLST